MINLIPQILKARTASLQNGISSKNVARVWLEKTEFFFDFNSVQTFLCVVYTNTGSKAIKYSFRHGAIWKYKTKKIWKIVILLGYPNKMRWYCRWNFTKCSNWSWTNFQIYRALAEKKTFSLQKQNKKTKQLHWNYRPLSNLFYKKSTGQW